MFLFLINDILIFTYMAILMHRYNDYKMSVCSCFVTGKESAGCNCFCLNFSASCLDSAADLGLVPLLIKCLDICQTRGLDDAAARQFRTKCILALSICVDQCGEEFFTVYCTLRLRMFLFNSEYDHIS